MMWRARCASSVHAFRLGRMRVTVCVKRSVVKAQHAAPLQARRSDGLGSGGAGDAVFEQGDELHGVAGWREAGLAGADDSEGFGGGLMGPGFFVRGRDVEF